ncbi:uncharacterized protein LOC119781938 [Cyprinodon tularosa]|uniref:uncharacterized protein LOC119781938 n=1 Tax=Cyprinodon tularosa TaxID=77115 RepID=UPI0018E1F57A|nr:uncharacterized protein LOC119781938 [Cyprinodon tularosa]
MDVPAADSEWRSPQFRQKVVVQIEDAMRKAGSGNTTHKSGTDMENHIFLKAKSREEYLSLVARLIIHFRDIHKKAMGAPVDLSHRQRYSCSGRQKKKSSDPRNNSSVWGHSSAMDVPAADSEWRSPQFRQKVVAQIEDAMSKAGCGNTTHKSGTDMENHVFLKAKSREEYLSLVARLIIHFRDIHKKAMGAPDPMNALNNLTGVGGGPGAIGMGPRPPGAAVGGMGAMGQMQLGQHAMAGVSGNPQASECVSC